MARAKAELRPRGIASGLGLLGGRSKLAGLDKFLLGTPANLKVSLNIYRGISISLRCRENALKPKTRRTFAICSTRSIAGQGIHSAIRNPLVPQPARAPRDFPRTTRFPSPSPRAARTI